MKKRKITKKLLCFFLIFSLLPWNVFNPTTVKADGTNNHDTYFIYTVLDEAGGYKAQVIADGNAFGDSKEEKMIKTKMEDADGNETYIDWSTIDYSDPIKASEEVKKYTGEGNPSLDESTGLPFSFPSSKRKTGASYQQDFERADDISSTLSANLNNLISTAKGTINYNALEIDNSYAHISNTIGISRALNPALKGTTDGNWIVVNMGNSKIYYAKYNESLYSEYMKKGEPQYDSTTEAKLIDASGNLLAYIVASDKTPTSSDKGFIWAMPKGYLNPITGESVNTGSLNKWSVGNDKQANATDDKRADARWLTIFSLAEFANAQALYHNTTLATTEVEESSFIEDTIYTIIYKLYSGLRNLLGLWTIPELIYNQGVRGGESYEGGLMSSSWWNQVLKYHLIFQILAWMMLILAVAKILLQVNFSTVNPQLTISIMDTLQKIFTVGFALALCIPLIKAMASLNNLIVGIFETQASDQLATVAKLGIAGLVILFGYLGITFTMNCIYIMRSIMIGILTASAPLFITSMAFAGPKQKGLFDNWLKEISANIFMQAVHAFAFAFLFDIMDASNILVQLVIYFSLLPIVDMCRQLIFGQAGGFAVAQGQKSAQIVGDYVTKTAKGKAAGALNFAGNKIANTLPGANGQGVDDPSSSGGSTSGEGKASNSMAKARNTWASIGTAMKNEAGADWKTQAKGSALRGLSKAGDFLESTGGIMGNAVTRANLGDVHGAMQANQTYGEGIATQRERLGNDITDTVSNIREYKARKGLDTALQAQRDANDKKVEAQEAYKEAFNTYTANQNSPASGSLLRSKLEANANKVSAQKEYDKATEDVKTYSEKLNSISNRRGSQSIKSADGSQITAPVSQFQFDSAGNITFIGSEEEASKMLGSDYEAYFNGHGGYKLGKNWTQSTKGNTVRVNAPAVRTSAFEKMIADDEYMKNNYYSRYNSNSNTTPKNNQQPQTSTSQESTPKKETPTGTIEGVSLG